MNKSKRVSPYNQSSYSHYCAVFFTILYFLVEIVKNAQKMLKSEYSK